MAKYYKKISKISPWTQPILTSNGTLGGDSFAVAGSPADSSLPAWRAFDGNTSSYAWCGGSLNPLTIYFPIPVNVSHIKSVCTSAYSNWQLRTWKAQVSDDNVTYKDITDTLSTSNGEVNNNLNYSGQYKYLRIMPITINAGHGWHAVEIYLTATHTESKWQPCTMAEYDQLPADQRKIVTDIYSIFNIEKYYKKIATILPWTQPIITEDGILGGNTFAVGVAPNYNEYKKIYLSFQKDLSANGGGAITGAGSYRAYIIYNPTPIKITNLHIKNVNEQQTHGGTVYGSNDGVTWTKIKDYTNTQFASRGEWDLDLSNNIEFYHYYKVDNGTYVIGGSSNYAWYLGEITITATQKVETWQECTKEEYDNSLVYYKKIETDWTQPTLKSNGTLGGNSFAVYTDHVYDGKQPYLASDGIIDTGASISNSGYFEFYTPIAIKLQSLQLYDRVTNYSYRPYAGGIYGSNDGSNWTLLTNYSFPNSVGNMNALPLLNVNAKIFYKYFKITVTKTGDNQGYWYIPEIQIGATQQAWQQCTKEEYDSLPDSDRMVDSNNRKIVTTFYSTKKISGYRDYSINFTDSNIQTVGTLAIDNKGVANGFSLNNYALMVPNNIPAPTSMEFVIAFRMSENQTGGVLLGGYGKYTSNGSNASIYELQHLYLNATKTGVSFSMYRTSKWGNYDNPYDVYNGSASVTLKVNKWYKAKIVYNAPSTWKFYVTNDSGNWVEYPTTKGARGNQLNDYSMPAIAQQRIGQNQNNWGGSSFFNGDIDFFNSYLKIDGKNYWNNQKEIKGGSIITNYLGGLSSEMKEVVERAWEQPVLTSNTSSSLMQVSASNEGQGSAYRALDGDTSTLWCTANNYTSATFTIKLSETIYITQIEITGLSNVYGHTSTATINGERKSFNYSTSDTVSFDYDDYATQEIVINVTGVTWCALTNIKITANKKITNNPTQQISQWQH